MCRGGERGATEVSEARCKAASIAADGALSIPRAKEPAPAFPHAMAQQGASFTTAKVAVFEFVALAWKRGSVYTLPAAAKSKRISPSFSK